MAGSGTGLGGLWRIVLEGKLSALEERLAKGQNNEGELRAVAAAKVVQGANLTRRETAAYLGISTRKIQRMEVSGNLARCPGLGSVVRYASRDVLKLASAR